MTLLNPTYLWGLLGLAIPIMIHLWSRKKVRTIHVGSIQFLKATKSRQSNRIYLNEYVLLFLRCLLIMLLVVLLCQPQWSKTTKPTAIAYFIEPALLKSPNAVHLDSLPPAQTFVFTNGFPRLTDYDLSSHFQQAPSYWQLAQELETVAADSMVVFSTQRLAGIKGKRPTVGASIEWIQLGYKTPMSAVVYAQKKGDRIQLTKVKSDEDYLAFAKTSSTQKSVAERLNANADSILVTQAGQQRWIPLEKETPIRIGMVYDQTNESQLPLLTAAIEALSVYIDTELQVKSYPIDDLTTTYLGERIIWLSETVPPKMETATLRLKKDSLASRTIVAGVNANEWYLTEAIHIGLLLDSQFMPALLDWLALDPKLAAASNPFDRRRIATAQITTRTGNVPSVARTVVKSAQFPWWWLLLGLLLFAERILASYRKQ